MAVAFLAMSRPFAQTPRDGILADSRKLLASSSQTILQPMEKDLAKVKTLFIAPTAS